MEATELIAAALNQNAFALNMALEGISEVDLNTPPKPDCNPPGWLLWHQVRVEDAVIARVTGGEQVWAEGDWGAKLDAAPDPANIGLGIGPEAANAMKFTKDTLTAYAGAVRERTLAALKKLTPADLDKEIPDFLPDTMIKIGDLLARAVLVDNFQHIGQICYLRGYHTGFGWLPF